MMIHSPGNAQLHSWQSYLSRRCNILPQLWQGGSLWQRWEQAREGGRVVRTLLRSRHLYADALPHCSRKACSSLSLSQRPMGGNSWHMSGHKVAMLPLCFKFWLSNSFSKATLQWRLDLGIEHITCTVYIISLSYDMRRLLQNVGTCAEATISSKKFIWISEHIWEFMFPPNMF